MAAISLDLNAELARWLQESATRRSVSLECTVLQLLEEERMRSTGATKLDVAIGTEWWTARMPMRGLLYSGYETEWERVPADH